MSVEAYCHARRAESYKIVGHNLRGLPEVEVIEPEEWEEPPSASFSLRQSLWADWISRRFARPGSWSFVWNNGNPYIVIRGWNQLVERDQIQASLLG